MLQYPTIPSATAVYITNAYVKSCVFELVSFAVIFSYFNFSLLLSKMVMIMNKLCVWRKENKKSKVICLSICRLLS